MSLYDVETLRLLAGFHALGLTQDEVNRWVSGALAVASSGAVEPEALPQVAQWVAAGVLSVDGPTVVLKVGT